MRRDGSFSLKEKLDKYFNNINRKLRGATSTNLLTMFPALTVIFCLMITGFFTTHSGVNDCRTGYEPSWCNEEGALNVNGEMEVYLPESTDPSSSKNLLEQVGENWTTNIMVVYVESEDYNVTQKEILYELDLIERSINSQRNDGGDEDSIVYVLSISTVIKEVNSSGGRLLKAFFNGLADATGNQDLSDSANETIDAQSDLIGNYAIPEEQDRIDRILEEMPQNALDKLVRDVGTFDAAGNVVNLSAKHWNRAVIIIGISDNLDKDGDGIDDNGGIPGIIDRTQLEIDIISVENNWKQKNLTMTLTGPTPLTNAITEESFKLFWSVFPVGVILVSLGLFLFHCDLFQTGRIRFVQGVKVVIITGLPTLCSVWITLGIIGFSNYEVTMTVIIVGPIVLALGVSYGLHITNRYAEAKGSPEEKIEEALNSTGKAVFLSATTTIIGFISLVFTPMAPIKTVGWSLAGGIVVVYIMTMLMVPNLTLLLDLKKPSHPPPKLFTKAVEIPINWTKVSLSFFILLMLFSAGISRQNIEENIDLLDMAPEEVGAVQKMKVYSNEFDSGQPGFILVGANIGAEPSFSFTAEHPYSNLEGIERLAGECDRIENTSAVSVVFLMKAIAVGVNVSGTPILDILDNFPLPPTIDDAAELIFDREASGNASFWAALDTLDAQEDDGGRQIQNFLLYVFYNTLTDEMREFFISTDYEKSLIYIDMPFIDSKSTSIAVNQINLKTDAAGSSGENSIFATNLIGVAPITIEINEMIVGSQWTSLFFALGFTILTLALVFRDLRYALLTTVPVGFTVAMQWIVMDNNGVPLNLVTVMIGSILVGVGVDFSIHIANRVKELGGDLDAIKTACASTGMSLFEATTVTAAGMSCAFLIPIPAIQPFVKVIIVLLVIAALAALLLLPAIYSIFVKMNWGLTGGVENMVKSAGIRRAIVRDEIDVIDAALIFGNTDDAW